MKIKKTIYIIVTMAIGVAVATALYGIAEILYIKWLTRTDAVYMAKSYFPKPVWWGSLAIGAIVGFLLGKKWWRSVYGGDQK